MPSGNKVDAEATSYRMKIAVIGGNGYLGHHVSKYFNADSLSRENGFDIAKGELGQKLSNYDVIIHMAAKVDKSGKDDAGVFRINSFGTENIVKSLKKNQILVFASTKEIYTPENDSYSASKLEAEKHIKKYAEKIGFRSGIFRLASIYAPATNGSTFVNYFMNSVRTGKELSLLMKGMQKRDFLYVDDLSSAFEKFIYSDIDNAVYDVGGGIKNSTTIGGLVELMGKTLEKKPIVIFSNGKVVGSPHYITDITKIKNELKWEPKVSLEKGLMKIL